MVIKQISVFVENKPGRLSEITRYLADEHINVHAISIADTTNFGILRLIVSNPDKAYEALKNKGLTVKETDVLVVALLDSPGSLAIALENLAREQIYVEYIYAFTKKNQQHEAMVILRLNDQENTIDKIKNIDDLQVVNPSFLYD